MRVTPGIGETFGRYRIEQRLGLGGMGVVYLALDTHMQRRVALKVMADRLAGDVEFLERFHREAETLTRLDSPHIITIFDHGEIDGTPYLATQYVAGGDLGSVLQAHGPMPPSLAADVCAQLAEALHDAHSAGVVHRDVKSGNVLVRDPAATRPFVYLCDFGIAQSGGSGLTTPGGVAGSWAYLSPERTRGEPATPASDVYALGCLFHACLTGRTPYSGSDVEIALAHAQQPVPALPGSGPHTDELNRVLGIALAKQPEDRYRDAEAFAHDLRAIAAGTVGVPAGPAPDPASPTRPAARPAPPAPSSAPGPQTGPSGSHGAVPPPGAGGSRGRRTAVIGGAAAAVLLIAGGAVAGVTILGDDEPAGPAADSAAGSITDPVAGDWDGDGLGDVRVTRSVWRDGSKPLPQQLFTSSGDAFGDATEDMGQMDYSQAGDFNGDGREDLLQLEEGNGDGQVRSSVWTGSQEGLGGEPAIQSFSYGDTNGLYGSYAVGDFDGDGMDDLVMTRSRSIDFLEIAVAISTGDGFEDPVQWGSRGGRDNTLDEVSVGDFDGDGKVDLFVKAPNGGVGARVRILQSTGTEFRKRPITQLRDAQYALSAQSSIDVDGDGADELVHLIPVKYEDLPDGGYTVGVEVTVMEFVNGSFVSPTTWAEAPRGYDDIPYLEIGGSDVDGDGDEDVVRLGGFDSETASAPLEVYVSDGAALAAPTTWGEITCSSDCEGESASLVTPAW